MPPSTGTASLSNLSTSSQEEDLGLGLGSFTDMGSNQERQDQGSEMQDRPCTYSFFAIVAQFLNQENVCVRPKDSPGVVV